MDRHPKEFIESWVDDLTCAFLQAERKFERSLDRGAPRERALRSVLSAFLPEKYGLTAGHVVSSAPAWSRQSDVIIYDRLESPIFSVDADFQGTVLPAEAVYGIIEVKSSLDPKSFRDAVDKIAEFKRLCAGVNSPKLTKRFGAVFAYRMASSVKDPDACMKGFVEIARDVNESERVDDLFILGLENTDISQSFYMPLIPKGGPKGPLDYFILPRGRGNLKVFLLNLDSRLRRVRTGQPTSLLGDLFDKETELGASSGPDPRRLRAHGELPVREVAESEIVPKIKHGRCHMCGSQEFSIYNDAYCLVATKDYWFGRLGGPQIPVVVLECCDCHSLALVSGNAHDITTAD